MFLAGIVIAVIGTAGIFTAVGIELETQEAVWKVLAHKVFPWMVCIGLALMGLGAMA